MEWKWYIIQYVTRSEQKEEVREHRRGVNLLFPPRTVCNSSILYRCRGISMRRMNRGGGTWKEGKRGEGKRNKTSRYL